MQKSEKPVLKAVQFHPLSEKELTSSIDYLNEERTGFGFRLSDEFEYMIESIRQFPESFVIVDSPVRQAVLKTFKYSILFAVRSELIYVLALAHHSRHPDYWKPRLKDMPQ